MSESDVRRGARRAHRGDPPANRPTAGVVGIGASAGGIPALRSLLEAVPADTGIIFVVVLHLAPDRESALADVLQTSTDMPVRQVDGRTRMKADHVYVIPPNRNLTVAGGHLEPAAFTEPPGQRAPIDRFFRTLAEHHPGCVGVLLSGSGTDGVVGLRAIQERSGVVLVQAPEDAQYGTMPRAAVETGVADLVLPARELGAKVVELRAIGPARRTPADVERLTEDEAGTLDRMLEQLHAHTGHDFSGYRKSTVLRRVGRRMRVTQSESLAAYLGFLRGHDTEWEALVKDLLISVTDFFRDAEAFAALEQQAVPALVARRASGPDEPIRAWVAGCATGEEAYSIAMLLYEAVRDVDPRPPIQIFATDVDDDAVAYARQGRYPEAIAADVSEERLNRFFTREPGYFRVRPEMRELVLFSPHNLLRDPPFTRLDLISSRNLLIYLERDLQRRIFQIFRYALRDDGYLFLGGSESVRDDVGFRVVDSDHRIFQRPPTARSEIEQAPDLPLSAVGRRRYHLPVPPTGVRGRAGTDAELHRRAVELHAPPSILVDRNHSIVHVSERANRYLEFPAGSPTANLLRVARGELRLELRSALHRALEHGEPVRSRPIPLEIAGEPRRAQLYVTPTDADARPDCALVVFLESDPAPAEEPAEHAGAARRLEETESELASLRARLQDVMEQSETRQEELRASNEELQSINEEYKTTLEELETSKEELQSMNEELTTVNDQLQAKVEEVARSNDDLRNLMAATQIATLFLDVELRIQRFTPALADLFNVVASDEGRPLGHITHSLHYDELADDCAAVLRTLQPVEREASDVSGREYLARITPYRAEDDGIAGVVATFTDVSRMRRAQEKLRQSEERFRVLIDATAQTVWTTDAQGQVVEDSPSWRSFTGQTHEQRLGSGWLDAVHQQDRATVAEAWRRAVASEQPFEAEFRLRHARGEEWRIMAVRAVPVRGPDGAVREWVGMNTDITERKRAEAALREAKSAAERSDRAKSQFLSMLSHELRTPLNAVIGSADLLEAGVSGSVTDAQRKHLTRITASAWHLVGIIDEILAFTRSEAGEFVLNVTRVDVAAIVRDVVAMLESQAAAKELALRLEGAEEAVPALVDPGKFRQITTNLVGNALKFTSEGAVDVELRSTDDALDLVIRDTGPGIRADQTEAVFEPFVQLDRFSIREQGGTGLGLTISRRLARALDGDIRLDSTPGEGSTFLVRLPRRVRPQPDAIAAPA